MRRCRTAARNQRWCYGRRAGNGRAVPRDRARTGSINPNRPAGVFTVRSADGGGLVRVTANPNGNHDIPGDYSPGGGRIVFLRITDLDSETGTLSS